MSLNTFDQEPGNGLPRLSSLTANYGVRVNELDVGELFDLYGRTGFFYPEKLVRLAPYLGIVKENWQRLFGAGDSLLYVLTAGDEDRGYASIAVWRSTRHGWTSQHLVSENNPFGSRAVMLAGSAASILRGVDESHQNWFRPENRFPSRIFGSMVQSIGESLSSVQRHMYFALPRNVALPTERRIRVVPYDSRHQEALCAIASLVRGRVYVAAEELARDVELQAIDQLYRNVGLRRTRQVWLAYRHHKDEPIGAAIAYRGPLGLNLSYLENRCDLLLHPTLPESEVPGVVASLLHASSAAYEDFELDETPVVAEEIAALALFNLGAKFLRHYCQGIWLKDGQPRFYRHVDSFYSRLLLRAEKHGIQPCFTV